MKQMIYLITQKYKIILLFTLYTSLVLNKHNIIFIVNLHINEYVLIFEETFSVYVFISVEYNFIE